MAQETRHDEEDEDRKESFPVPNPSYHLLHVKLPVPVIFGHATVGEKRAREISNNGVEDETEATSATLREKSSPNKHEDRLYCIDNVLQSQRDKLCRQDMEKLNDRLQSLRRGKTEIVREFRNCRRKY